MQARFPNLPETSSKCKDVLRQQHEPREANRALSWVEQQRYHFPIWIPFLGLLRISRADGGYKAPVLAVGSYTIAGLEST